MAETAGKFSKEDAFKTLDTTNMLINNCDTKASITLGAIGIVATILFSSNLIDVVMEVIEMSFEQTKGALLIYDLILWGSIISVLVGLFFQVKVLIPGFIVRYDKNATPFNSVMFYKSVAQKEYSNYCDEIKNISEEQILKDLLFQIHSVSKICNAKYINFKIGIIFFGCGAIVAIIQMLIGWYCIL